MRRSLKGTVAKSLPRRIDPVGAAHDRNSSFSHWGIPSCPGPPACTGHNAPIVGHNAPSVASCRRIERLRGEPMARSELRVPVRYYLRLGEVLAQNRVDIG